MAKEGITPEEKLLKIIERPEDHKNVRVTQKLAGGFLNVKGWSLFRNIRSKQLISFKFSLHFFNRISMVLAAGLTIFFVFDFARDRIYLKKRFSLAIEIPKDKAEITEKVFPEVDLKATIRQAKKNDIFTLTPQVKPVKKKVRQKDISTLKLVGILWSSNPQAMIEDTEIKKTYILNSGDQIDRWKVRKIYNDKVVLIDEKDEWELR